MRELDLFAAAITIADPAERAALLDRECVGQSDLRRRLDELLEAHGQAHFVLDKLDRDSTVAVTRATASALAPRTVSSATSAKLVSRSLSATWSPRKCSEAFVIIARPFVSLQATS